jgi:thiamine biosynthesis lipoprotein
VVAVVPVRRGAVATSGHSHRGHHIVDARSGVSPTGIASVTVVAADVLWADIDATAAYAMGSAGSDWLQLRGRTGLVVGDDESVVVIGDRVAPASHRRAHD